MREKIAQVQNGRSALLDVMKGIAIIGIVLVHIFALEQAGDSGRSVSPVFQQLYLVLMSFFIINGIFYRPERSFTDNVKRHVLPLMVIMVASAVLLPAVMYVWMAACGQVPTGDDLVESILRGFSLSRAFVPADSPVDTYPLCGVSFVNYFLWQMAFAMLLFYAVARWSLSSRVNFAVTVAALLIVEMGLVVVNIALPFYMGLSPIIAAFMLVGAYAKQSGIIERLECFEWRTGRFWLIFLGSVAALAVLVIVLPPGTMFDFVIFGDHGALSVVPYFIESILVTVFFAYMCLLFSKIPYFADLLCMYGRHTLGIALSHVLLAKMIMAVFFVFTTATVFPAGIGTPQLAAIGLAVLVIAPVLCILWGMMLGRIRDKRSGNVPEPTPPNRV